MVENWKTRRTLEATIGPLEQYCDKVHISALTLLAEEYGQSVAGEEERRRRDFTQALVSRLKKAQDPHKLAFWLLFDSVLKNVRAYHAELVQQLPSLVGRQIPWDHRPHASTYNQLLHSWRDILTRPSMMAVEQSVRAGLDELKAGQLKKLQQAGVSIRPSKLAEFRQRIFNTQRDRVRALEYTRGAQDEPLLIPEKTRAQEEEDAEEPEEADAAEAAAAAAGIPGAHAAPALGALGGDGARAFAAATLGCWQRAAGGGDGDDDDADEERERANRSFAWHRLLGKMYSGSKMDTTGMRYSSRRKYDEKEVTDRMFRRTTQGSRFQKVRAWYWDAGLWPDVTDTGFGEMVLRLRNDPDRPHGSKGALPLPLGRAGAASAAPPPAAAPRDDAEFASPEEEEQRAHREMERLLQQQTARQQRETRGTCPADDPSQKYRCATCGEPFKRVLVDGEWRLGDSEWGWVRDKKVPWKDPTQKPVHSGCLTAELSRAPAVKRQKKR